MAVTTSSISNEGRKVASWLLSAFLFVRSKRRPIKSGLLRQVIVDSILGTSRVILFDSNNRYLCELNHFVSSNTSQSTSSQLSTSSPALTPSPIPQRKCLIWNPALSNEKPPRIANQTPDLRHSLTPLDSVSPLTRCV
jgi:hypothetical protein